MKKTLTTILIFSIFVTPALVPMSVSAAGISSLSKGLVGHWMLDGKTKAKDLTPQGNNGTAQGGLTVGGATDQKGQANKATTFDGTNDTISIPSLGTLNAPFTISEWVYFNNNTQPASNYDYGVMMGTGANMVSFSRDASGGGNQDKFYTYTENGQKFGPVLVGQTWNHIVLVANSGAPYLQLYINGISQTIDQPSAAIQTNGKIDIGVYAPGSIHYLDGKASDLHIYNRALSSTEVAKLYQTTK